MRRRVEIADNHGLAHLHDHIDSLGLMGHSDDDTDREQPGRTVYRIKHLKWRSRRLTKLLRDLDVLSIASRFSENGKPLAGEFPRERIANEKREDLRAKPVTGLPRAFYDENWLRMLTAQEREMLHIKDVDEIGRAHV